MDIGQTGEAGNLVPKHVVEVQNQGRVIAPHQSMEESTVLVLTRNHIDAICHPVQKVTRYDILKPKLLKAIFIVNLLCFLVTKEGVKKKIILENSIRVGGWGHYRTNFPFFF